MEFVRTPEYVIFLLLLKATLKRADTTGIWTS